MLKAFKTEMNRGILKIYGLAEHERKSRYTPFNVIIRQWTFNCWCEDFYMAYIHAGSEKVEKENVSIISSAEAKAKAGETYQVTRHEPTTNQDWRCSITPVLTGLVLLRPHIEVCRANELSRLVFIKFMYIKHVFYFLPSQSVAKTARSVRTGVIEQLITTWSLACAPTFSRGRSSFFVQRNHQPAGRQLRLIS